MVVCVMVTGLYVELPVTSKLAWLGPAQLRRRS